jgi:hypothetical protein
MRSSSLRPLCLAALLATLAGCGSNPSCGGNLDYLQSVDRPRLRLPADLKASERIAPMTIPDAVPGSTQLDPAPRCIDEPPAYIVRKAQIALPVEETVNAWALAWSERRTDAVVQAYSSSFQPSGVGGAAAFLEQRRVQISDGQAPEAQLDELTVTEQGADRRVARFVQRFGENSVRKELILAREGGGWRIVSERILEVL